MPRGDWEGCGLWHPSQSPPRGWCPTWPLLLFRARACPGVTGRGAACGTPPSHPPGLVSDVAVAVVQSASVPRGDWEGCGLWHPRPHYSHHVYYSASCRPSHSECLVFHALHQRAPVSVRDTVLRISSTEDAESLDTDVKMEAYIRVSLRVA